MNNGKSGSLASRTALVTGGSRGMGAATSKLLAARGANVILNYFKNKEAADKVVREIKADNYSGGGGDAIAIQADVREPTHVEHMVEEAIQHYGQINILLNNTP